MQYRYPYTLQALLDQSSKAYKKGDSDELEVLLSLCRRARVGGRQNVRRSELREVQTSIREMLKSSRQA
jgi:hypothetical protein